MTLNNLIYQKVKQILFQNYAYPMDQIQPEIRFQIELAIDSLEMFELINQFEEVFKIKINKDDIDEFIFQPQEITYINDIYMLTIQDAVDYIEKQVKVTDYKKNYINYKIEPCQ